MVDVNLLKGTIIAKGMNVATLADQMDVNKATLYRKLADHGDPITLKEADKIVGILGLNSEEATRIFFAQYVS